MTRAFCRGSKLLPWLFYNMMMVTNNISSLGRIGLLRLIKVLCLFLVLLTYLLHYVIQNAVITPTIVVRPSLSSRPKKDEYVSSSLDTFFRHLNLTQCPTWFTSSPSPRTSNNGLWKQIGSQEKRPSNTFLHSAFLDARTEYANVSYKFVRVLALKQGRDGFTKYYCHFHNSQGIFVEANYHEIWVSAWHANPPSDYFHPIMIHCPVPKNVTAEDVTDNILIAQDKPCDNGNAIWLPLQQQKQTKAKQDFCVCVKPLDFPAEPRLARRLIEWIEANILLGAEKIVFYVYAVHDDVWKVLRRYNEQGIVQVIPWALPAHLPNDPERRWQFLHNETWQRRRFEVLPYNHCLYSNMAAFNYVIPLDIDEIILPTMDQHWAALMQRVLYKQHGLLDTVASFAVQNTYYFSNWNLTANSHGKKKPTSFPSLLQSQYRTANFSQVGHSVKSFINSKVARTVFNHYALSVLHPGQKFVVNLNQSVAQLNHYKSDCPSSGFSSAECQPLLASKVFDDGFIQRFGPRIRQKLENYSKTL